MARAVVCLGARALSTRACWKDVAPGGCQVPVQAGNMTRAHGPTGKKTFGCERNRKIKNIENQLLAPMFCRSLDGIATYVGKLPKSGWLAPDITGKGK